MPPDRKVLIFIMSFVVFVLIQLALTGCTPYQEAAMQKPKQNVKKSPQAVIRKSAKKLHKGHALIRVLTSLDHTVNTN